MIWRDKDLEIEVSQAVIDWFWSRVVKLDTCWLWVQDGKSPYGQFYLGKFEGRKIYCLAHRFSYQLHYGDIKADHVIMHSCDRPRCIRPEHLSQGTYKDNKEDARLKGINQYKLSPSDVDEIRALLKRPGIKQTDIAAMFNVHQCMISRIKSGDRHKEHTR